VKEAADREENPYYYKPEQIIYKFGIDIRYNQVNKSDNQREHTSNGIKTWFLNPRITN